MRSSAQGVQVRPCKWKALGRERFFGLVVATTERTASFVPVQLSMNPLGVSHVDSVASACLSCHNNLLEAGCFPKQSSDLQLCTHALPEPPSKLLFVNNQTFMALPHKCGQWTRETPDEKVSSIPTIRPNTQLHARYEREQGTVIDVAGKPEGQC